MEENVYNNIRAISKSYAVDDACEDIFEEMLRFLAAIGIDTHLTGNRILSDADFNKFFKGTLDDITTFLTNYRDSYPDKEISTLVLAECTKAINMRLEQLRASNNRVAVYYDTLDNPLKKFMTEQLHNNTSPTPLK